MLFFICSEISGKMRYFYQILLICQLYHIFIEMNTGLKIGWIGTGVMGLSMCKHLLAASYNLTVYNRTPEKAKPLLDLGAKWLEPK